MMNPEVKAKWVKALRSGEYKQGKKDLRVVDAEGNKTYCCLGVLCEIYAKDHGIKDPFGDCKGYQDNGNGMYCEFKSITGHGIGTGGTLPKEVREWAGMDSERKCGDIDFPDLNDIKGTTFLQLADIIEKEC